MFVDLSRNDELSAFFADLLDSDDEFKQRFIMAISKLDSNWWRMLEQAARDATERFGGALSGISGSVPLFSMQKNCAYVKIAAGM